MDSFGRVSRAFAFCLVADVAVIAVGVVIDQDVVVLVGGILAAVSFTLALTFFLVQRRLFGNPKDLARVRVEGLPTNATIAGVGTSGRVNGQPLTRLELSVNMMTVIVRTIVPPHLTAGIAIGASLPVRVDPDDPNLCVVDWDSVR